MPNSPEGFERYEEPRLTTEEEEIEYVSESPFERVRSTIEPYVQQAAQFARERAIPLAKQHHKQIAAGITAIIVIYLLYWFFFAGVRGVDFYVTDAEGDAIGAATVRIYPAGADEALDQFTGSKTISMRFGSYEADIAAAGYRGVSRFLFEVGPESASREFVLEQDKDLTLQVMGFPDKLYLNERRTVTATVTNRGDEAAVLDFVPEGGLASDAEIVFGAMQVPGGATLNVDFEIAVKADAEAKTNRKGSIRIEGLLEKVTVSYDLIEFDPGDLKLDRTSLDFGTVNAGGVTEKEVKVTNRSNGAVDGITFEVRNVSALRNSPGEIPNWFSFNPPVIDSLAPGSIGQRVAVSVNVPTDAKTDNIDALVVFKTTFWESALNVDLKVEAVEVELSLQGFDGTYNISKVGNEYEEKIDVLTLKNTGDIDIEGVELQVDSICTEQWVKFSRSEIDRIRVGQGPTVAMTISAPSTFAPDKTRVCNLRIVYPDPRNPLAEPIEMGETILIQS